MKRTLVAFLIIVISSIVVSSIGAENRMLQLKGGEWVTWPNEYKQAWAIGFSTGSYMTTQLNVNNKRLSGLDLADWEESPAPYSIGSDVMVAGIDKFYEMTGRLDYPVVIVAFIWRWPATWKGYFNDKPWETVEGEWE
jgi:hypothetical protein